MLVQMHNHLFHAAFSNSMDLGCSLLKEATWIQLEDKALPNQGRRTKIVLALCVQIKLLCIVFYFWFICSVLFSDFFIHLIV